jgi:hypothetical protein
VKICARFDNQVPVFGIKMKNHNADLVFKTLIRYLSLDK